MDRRTFIGAMTGGLLAAPITAEGQGPGTRSKRVGILSVGGGSPATIEPFFRALRDLGWVEGKNLAIERRIAEGHEERLPSLAAELTRLRVDVILAAGGPASLNAARQATKTIPIVMVTSSRDPVGSGLIQSYARPGGNITGIVTAPEGLTGKQLELLKTVVPSLSRVGVLWDGPAAGSFQLDSETAETARALKVELLAFEVRHARDFGRAVDAAAKARVGGLLLPGTPMFIRNGQQLAELLMRNRLPAITVWRSLADAGVLMAYGPSLPDQFRQAAAYVDKILKGANPGDLPIEQPTKFELVINLKTAKALGLAIAPSLLQRTDQVIEQSRAAEEGEMGRYRKFLVTAFMIVLAGCATTERVADVPSRPGITERVLVLAPENPKAVVVLFAGGHGGLQIGPNGGFSWGEGNFLVRSRQLFASQGLMVVVVDAPSDRQQSPYLGGFRQTPEHVADIKALIAWLKQRANVPVWLVGTSRGTQSVAFVATMLPAAEGGPDGIVLTSTILTDPGSRPVPAMPLANITTPVLVAHHKLDGCAFCNYRDLPKLMDKLTAVPRKELLTFEGGMNRGDPCDAMAYHGFNGIEQEVVAKVAEWITRK